MKTIDYLLKFDGKIVLIVHKNPDPDCIGSALALYKFLKNFKSDVKIVSKDEPPQNLDYLKGFNEIIVNNFQDANLYVLIDTPNIKRTGFDNFNFNNKNIIKIDHHISDDKYSEFDYVKIEAPSTTYLILELIRNYNENYLDEDMAECIFIGLVGDTGSFSYSNLKLAFEAALYLANKGYDLSKFSERYSRNNSISRFCLIRKALETLKQDGEIAYIVIRKHFYDDCSAKKYENFGIVDYPLSIKGVKVALKFEEIENNKWKINLRSKKEIDVQKFASLHGGGGHKNASAFEKLGTEEEVINEVISDLKEYLKSF
ncbi:MAG: bifunctional oligoribonuclease/PAP phosphatase NrnA [candidate division WOR-3 bacterium]